MNATAQAATVVLTHMATHGLPEPASLNLSCLVESETRIQVRAHDLTATAGVLLAWARTVPAVALHAWRAGASSVHLDVDTTLPGPSGDVKLTVFGGVAFDPDVFADLEPGQTVPVSLGQLTEWAGALGVAA